MENIPDDHETEQLTPRKRRGLVFIPVIILFIVVLVFVGMNLGHYKQLKEGEPAGNSANVAGPDNR